MRKTKKLEPPLWESVLLLQILWSAEAKRLALAASAALAAREEDDVSMDLARTLSAGGRASPVAGGRASPLSGIAGRAAAGAPPALPQGVDVRALGGATAALQRTSSATPAGAGAAVPRTCFHIDALLSENFPPELELKLFSHHARMQVVDVEALVTDSAWEVGPNAVVPAPMMSFMANQNLVPVGYKQRVLKAENSARQLMEQHQSVMAGNLDSLISWGLPAWCRCPSMRSFLSLR